MTLENSIKNKTTKKERFTYGLYFFGQNFYYMLVAMNVQTFFTDLGITAAAVAVILLATKIWDAVNDPLFGILVDRVRFKNGKFMPWIRMSLPFIALSTLLIFLMPNGANPVVKMAWAVVSYVLWDMAYTVCDVPIFALPMSMTDKVQERTTILSFGRLLATFGAMAAMIAIPALQKGIGWVGTAMIYIIIGVVTMMPILFTVKERYVVHQEKKISFKEMFKYLKGNEYLIIFYLSLLVLNITNSTNTVALYFARYNLGDQNLGTLLMAIAVVPILIVAIFMPKITKKVDKFYVYIGSIIGIVLMNVIRYFVGYSNIVIFFSLTFIQAIFLGGQAILLYMFTPDCVEYGHYKTGERAEGISFSLQTFTVKLISSLVVSVTLGVLAWFGFKEGVDSIQPGSALTGLWFTMTLFPALGGLFSIPLLLRYKLRDKYVQAMARCNMGEITRAEAAEILDGKF